MIHPLPDAGKRLRKNLTAPTKPTALTKERRPIPWTRPIPLTKLTAPTKEREEGRKRQGHQWRSKGSPQMSLNRDLLKASIRMPTRKIESKAVQWYFENVYICLQSIFITIPQGPVCNVSIKPLLNILPHVIGQTYMISLGLRYTMT